MGDGITDDGDLVIKISDEQAGGDGGQLILDSATGTVERDNSGYSGIGNKEQQIMAYGNPSGTVSVEGYTTPALARLVVDLWENRDSPASASFLGNNLEMRAGKLDWNTLEWDISDDGEAMLAIDAEMRDFEFQFI